MDNELIKELKRQNKFRLKNLVNQRLNILTKEGYYLSDYFLGKLDLAYLNIILSDWDNIDKSEFNSKLKELIETNALKIQKEISGILTKRKEVIECIFELYKSKNYIAIIPLILSQVDGIMKEITNGNAGFYMAYPEKSKQNPNQLKYLDKELYVNFLSEYEQLNVENRNDYELFGRNISDMTKFNRHTILHGESCEYANELNSIKAMLLLAFITEIYRVNIK